METIRKFYLKGFSKTSIASLVYFRILFGMIMLWEVYRYFSKGWIPKYYIRPKFNFTYYGFHWLEPLPGNGMYYVWGLIGLLAIFIAFGFFYRLSIIIFFFLFSYVFLIAKSHYLNHFYFVILVSFIMIFISPHKAYSLDAEHGRIKQEYETENWQLWLLRFQMGVVYFFGGVAKIDPDWIFGVPLNRWLNVHKNVPVVGGFLSSDTTALYLSWGGLLLDLLIVPFLLYKRTRLIGFIALAIFHISNHFLFKIGIFPWFSLGMTALFFSSDFPLKIFKKLWKVKWPKVKNKIPKQLSKNQKVAAVFITLFVLYNCLMPLRHHLYKGDVHWNEVGHAYSWRMKLRSKRAAQPVFYFMDKDTGEKWQEKASYRLRKKQWSIMGGHPEMILQYAHYLRDHFHAKGHKNLRVRVKAKSSVNYRDYQRIVKKRFNLEDVEDCLFCNPSYINPLTKENQRSFSRSYQKFMSRK